MIGLLIIERVKLVLATGNEREGTGKPTTSKVAIVVKLSLKKSKTVKFNNE